MARRWSCAWRSARACRRPAASSSRPTATRCMSACHAAAVECLMTRADHASGSDRLAEACTALGLHEDEVVVNVQGDEPLIDPALIDDCAALLRVRADCVMATVAHAIDELAEFVNPNVVKVVLDRAQRALYFSRAPIPWWRDGSRPGQPALHDTQRRASPRGPVRVPRRLPSPLPDARARARRSDRGARAAARACGTASASPFTSAPPCRLRVSTRPKTSSACGGSSRQT